MVARCLLLSVAALCANDSSPALSFLPAAPRLFAEQKPKLPLKKLDGATQARVLAALAGLVILWFAFIVFIWWGGRVARRYMRSPYDARPEDKPTVIDRDDWARTPLVEKPTSDES